MRHGDFGHVLLINTPLQWGGARCRAPETVSTVFHIPSKPLKRFCVLEHSRSTPLKWGVNERGVAQQQEFMKYPLQGKAPINRTHSKRCAPSLRLRSTQACQQPRPLQCRETVAALSRHNSVNSVNSVSHPIQLNPTGSHRIRLNRTRSHYTRSNPIKLKQAQANPIKPNRFVLSLVWPMNP